MPSFITKQEFNSVKNNTTKYSLGLATKIAKELIAKICEINKLGKKLKKFNKSCCKIAEQQSLTYGCTEKKQYFQKKYKKKYTWKKKKKSFKPGKYFKKREIKPSEKEKFCPKGKKNCRCWICSEEGHYANECPNRKIYPNKVKFLEEIQELRSDLIPVEDIYDESCRVYKAIEESDYESDVSNGDYSE